MLTMRSEKAIADRMVLTAVIMLGLRVVSGAGKFKGAPIFEFRTRFTRVRESQWRVANKLEGRDNKFD